MYLNKILHDLVCMNCNEVQLNGISTVKTENDLSRHSHQELVAILDNFKEVQCEKCNATGKWIVSKIFLLDTNK